MKLAVAIDDRVRTTAAALLLTKFADENAGSLQHPMRMAARDRLEALREHPFAALRRKLAGDHWMHAFYAHALLVDRYVSDIMDPEDDFAKCGFAAGLRQFDQEPCLVTLWERTVQAWADVITECEEILAEAGLESFLTRLFGGNDLRLVLLPNPLDPPTFGFGSRAGRSAYAIIGPPLVRDGEVSYRAYGRELADLAFHEFSHTLWSDCLKSRPSFTGLYSARLSRKCRSRKYHFCHYHRDPGR